MNCADLKKALLLYAVTESCLSSGKSCTEDVRKALDGGVTFVQFREKHISGKAFLKEASALKALCKKYGVPFIVNDDVQAAEEIDADGVHVGQSDMDALKARSVLGKNKILGVSVQTAEQAILAEKNGADYLGAGAVFPTGSKDDAKVIDYKTLKDICNAVDIPVVAIGGINAGNIKTLKGSGISGAAVISALFSKPDIEAAAKELKAAVSEALND